jgi:hypothetical protein
MFLVAGVLAALSFLAPPSAGKNEIALPPGMSKSTEPAIRREGETKSHADIAWRASIAQDLKMMEAYFESPAFRQEISGLSQGATAETICQFSKDWFISQDKNLAVLWEYIKARQSAWLGALRDEVFALVDEGIRKRQGGTYQPTQEEILQVISTGIKEVPQKLGECGFLVRAYIAWKNDKVARYQKLSAAIFAETARQLVRDVEDSDEGIWHRAIEVTRALHAAHEGARRLSTRAVNTGQRVNGTSAHRR